MLKNIKLFANHSAYNSVKNNLDKPNVVLCAQEDEVHYEAAPPNYRYKIVMRTYSGGASTCIGGVLNGDVFEIIYSGTSDAFVDYIVDLESHGDRHGFVNSASYPGLSDSEIYNDMLQRVQKKFPNVISIIPGLYVENQDYVPNWDMY